jgi:hypothetical protein
MDCGAWAENGFGPRVVAKIGPFKDLRDCPPSQRTDPRKNRSPNEFNEWSGGKTARNPFKFLEVMIY